MMPTKNPTTPHPTSESALKMLSYVTPGFYDKSYVGKWMFQVMGLEYDKALKLAEDFSVRYDAKGHDPPRRRPVKRKISEELRYRQAGKKRPTNSPFPAISRKRQPRTTPPCTASS